LRSDTLSKKLKQDVVRFAQLEIPDLNGFVRGKLSPLEVALSPAGSGVSSLIYSMASRDTLAESRLNDISTGFPKVVAIPDLDTAIPLPWHEGIAALLCDVYDENGSPSCFDTRQRLKTATAECEGVGFSPRAALEFECYVFEADRELLRSGAVRELVPLGLHRDLYSLTRSERADSLAREFLARMAAVDIPVEAFHAEGGMGMYEFVLAHQPIVKAADDATRAKLYFKKLCIEFGLVATFMPAVVPPSIGCFTGLHHNFSLWQGERNILWNSESKSLSSVGAQFAAGILKHMSAMSLVFRPWVNSYRRMNRLAFCPENVSWGVDNHTVALRLVHGFSPEHHTRFEHRVAGPDVNPYLTLLAILLAGLDGIRDQLAPPELTLGDALARSDNPPLPRTLNESTTLFEKSEFCRQSFGDALVDVFTAVRQREWNDYQSWLGESGQMEDENITSWEYDRYFDYV
jgi:glutamine synthetase